MKRLLFILFTVLSVSAFAFKAADVAFSIEEEDLVSMPDSVVTAIKNAKWKGYNDCDFTGKKLPLSKKTSASFYAVTTTEACGWRAAQGPIWIVKADINKTDVILSDGGYNLVIDKGIHDGMPDIVIEAGTASRAEESFWSFDKDHYKNTGSTSHSPGE